MLADDSPIAAEEIAAWQAARAVRDERVRALQADGVCYQCAELADPGAVLGGQTIIAEDAHIRICLCQDPRVDGHTIVVWKPHAADFTELSADECQALFWACTQTAAAMKLGLGCERVYLVSMCDGENNHLHIQLIPRYAGQQIGSRRLVDPRRPVRNGDAIAAAIRSGLDRVRWQTGPG